MAGVISPKGVIKKYNKLVMTQALAAIATFLMAAARLETLFVK
jgi:hypothetical protein